MGDKKIVENKIADLFQNDLWVRSFMQETYRLFGLPVSSEDCLNKQDKIFFLWGMMSLVKAMQSNHAWEDLKKDTDAEEAAYKFAEIYFNETGNLIVDSTYSCEK